MPDTTFFIQRDELERVGFSPRAVRSFEEMQRKVAETEETSTAGVEATGSLREASFVVLSANEELPNEYVLSVGEGLRLEPGPDGVTLYSDAPRINADFPLAFSISGPSELALPLTGIVATRSNEETFENKTLDAPLLTGLGDYADDAAAAAGGVPVTGVYRTGSALKVRVA